MSLCVFLLQWWQVEKVNPIKLYEENKVIAGFSLLNILFKHRKSGLLKSVMEKLLRLYEQKKIKPVVDSLWALEEVRAWPDQMMELLTASREKQTEWQVNMRNINNNLINLITRKALGRHIGFRYCRSQPNIVICSETLLCRRWVGCAVMVRNYYYAHANSICQSCLFTFWYAKL